MTEYLLDTHVVLWSQLEPTRLGPATTNLLNNPGVRLWVSPLTIWEVALLASKRRVQLELPLREWTQRTLGTRGIRLAALSLEVVLSAADMRLEHGDPVDRLLAATALVAGLTMLTADAKLLTRSDIQVMAATT